MGHHRSPRQGRSYPHGRSPDLGEAGNRRLVGEARRNGMIGREEAANLNDLPNVQQKGTRLGNWLTREQAKQLLAEPDRSKLKGKRDYVIIDLRGKGGRIRTVAVPIWVN